MDITQSSTIGTFATTGLSAPILSALATAGFIEPTPIQAECIPIALEGSDVIGVAQTGTGKTLAFGLPILQTLGVEHGRALILTPTRELALQVEESIRNIAALLRPSITTVSLIGGTSMYMQIQALRRHPRVIVATPGRLQDHIDHGTVDLRDVVTLVLDEADRMLDMGFISQIKRIMKAVPPERQTMLFSATMSPEVTKLASAYLIDPVRVEVAKSGTAAENIEQQLCYVAQDRKPEMLQTLLNRYEGSVLVFSRTKHGAAKLSRRLLMDGHRAIEIHSNRTLGQRRQALDGFKSGKYRVMVATDVASRGIDVHDIAVVINYDLPDAAEDYVHRIGRTGRAGKSGLAISLAGHDQYRDVSSIEKLMNMPLPLSEYSEQPHQRPQTSSYSSSSRATSSRSGGRTRGSAPRFGGPRGGRG